MILHLPVALGRSRAATDPTAHATATPPAAGRHRAPAVRWRDRHQRSLQLFAAAALACFAVAAVAAWALGEQSVALAVATVGLSAYTLAQWLVLPLGATRLSVPQPSTQPAAGRPAR